MLFGYGTGAGKAWLTETQDSPQPFFPMAVKSSSLCCCGSNYDLLVCLSVLKNPSFSESYLNTIAVFPEMGLLIQEGPLSKTYF